MIVEPMQEAAVSFVQALVSWTSALHHAGSLSGQNGLRYIAPPGMVPPRPCLYAGGRSAAFR